MPLLENAEQIGVMIDIETMSTSTDAHILSIGACTMPDTGKHFSRRMGAVDQGRAISIDTVTWWSKQSDSARSAAFDDSETDDIVTLDDALHDFSDFYTDSGATSIWGHGSVFDVSIIEHAMRQNSIGPPWRYHQIRDTRTLIDLIIRITGKDMKPIRAGTHHNALDDAIYQAQWMNRIFHMLTGDKVYG